MTLISPWLYVRLFFIDHKDTQILYPSEKIYSKQKVNKQERRKTASWVNEFSEVNHVKNVWSPRKIWRRESNYWILACDSTSLYV